MNLAIYFTAKDNQWNYYETYSDEHLLMKILFSWLEDNGSVSE